MKLLRLTPILFILFLSNIGFAQDNSTIEICDNRIDDDGDGLIDCLDPDCAEYNSCWQCETEFYQVHSNTTVVSLDPRNGTYNVKANITGATQINGAQFNHIDGHVYAPCVIDGQHQLGMLSQDGSVTPAGLILPGSSIFYCGAISKEGVMYLSNRSGIHSIDLNQEELSVVDTGLPHSEVADFSLDLNRGLFYGITSSKTLVVFDPYLLQLKSYDLAGTINNDSGGFGAAWSCNDGSFFAYNNSSGKIYSVDVNNLTATEVLNATGNLSINDGFNCVLAPPPFESNCSNNTDDDADGMLDCDDPDCYSSNICTVEICNNGIDDDLDGWIDCSDSECFALEVCLEICGNGIDDNGNGLVDGDDPQCGTTSGVTGGLESNRRLADKIALRNFYTKVKEPQAFHEKNEGLIPFNIKELKSNKNVSHFVPNNIPDLQMAESSPEDLINITNAVQVVGVDYYADDQRVASILGLLSTEGVYEHTKYICDRVGGSRLLDVSYLAAHDGNFISYELLTKNGQQEYAVSFSAYLDEDGKFQIENHWNLSNYTKKRDYYNFQIWANNYERLIQLLESMLAKMEVSNGIKSIVHSEIPKVFVTYGEYTNGQLRLVIKNKNRSQLLRFKSKLRRAEYGEIEEYNEEIILDKKSQQVITLNTGHFFDIGASLKFDDLVHDEIYLADGAWGIGRFNPGSNVNVFEVNKNESEYDESVYEVERAVEVEAEVKDYLNVYRSLDPKLNPKDLSEFNSLAFKAAGIGKLEITLVKESILEWENQFRTTITLTNEEGEYFLMNEDLVSKNSGSIEFDDLTMVVFTILGDNNSFKNKELKLSEVRFQNSIISSTMDLTNTSNSKVFPNPVKDITTIEFDSAEEGSIEIKIIDNTGQVLQHQNSFAKKGFNSKKLNLTKLIPGLYYFKISGHSTKVIEGKILKID